MREIKDDLDQGWFRSRMREIKDDLDQGWEK